MNDTQAFPARFPEDVYEGLRELAHRSRISMNSLVNEGVRMRLELEESLRIGTSVKSPGGLYETWIDIEGIAQSLYRASDGQVYVAGLPGVAYSVRVRNLTAGRIEVVNSVDGRNSLKDEAASLSARGILVRPHDAYDFAGFQQDDSRGSRFVFCDPGQAIATQATGSAENVGVIGLAGFREYVKPRPAIELRDGYDDHPVSYRGSGLVTRGGYETMGLSMGSSATYDTAPVAMAGMSPGLGTGMGEDFSNPLTSVSFARSGSADLMEIRYDTEENLRAKGIIGNPEPQRPRAFPGEPTGYSKYERV